MRKTFFYILLLLAAHTAIAQTQYEVVPDAEAGKFLKGIISREILESDTSFKWYGENLKGYAPNAAALASLKEFKDSLQLLVFMGTWCDDSHYIVPKFFQLMDAAGYPKDKISLIATDRNKKTLGFLSEALNVKSVPTIIVMKNGVELGRVVEYGKSGLFDKDLAEILAGLKR